MGTGIRCKIKKYSWIKTNYIYSNTAFTKEVVRYFVTFFKAIFSLSLLRSDSVGLFLSFIVNRVYLLVFAMVKFTIIKPLNFWSRYALPKGLLLHTAYKRVLELLYVIGRIFIDFTSLFFVIVSLGTSPSVPSITMIKPIYNVNGGLF
jgi:hypothetical protein